MKPKTPYEHFLYWKLAIAKASGKALISIVLSLAQALNGTDWGNLTPTQKFITLSLAVGTGWAVIDAFLDQTMNTLAEKSKRPLAQDGSTDTVVETTTTTEVKNEKTD
jgi:hypothetical protein